jgi:hypothetical protein
MAQDAKTSCAIFHYILKNLSFYAEKVDIMTDTIKALTLNPRPARASRGFHFEQDELFTRPQWPW